MTAAETVQVIARRDVRLRDGRILRPGDRAVLDREQAVIHAVNGYVGCGEDPAPDWWPGMADVSQAESTLRAQRRQARAAALPSPHP